MTPADNEQSQRKLGQQSGVSGKLGLKKSVIESIEERDTRFEIITCIYVLFSNLFQTSPVTHEIKNGYDAYPVIGVVLRCVSIDKNNLSETVFDAQQ